MLLFQTQPMDKPFLLPFMRVEADNSTLSQYYQQVKGAMLKVDENEEMSDEAVDEFAKMANTW